MRTSVRDFLFALVLVLVSPLAVDVTLAAPDANGYIAQYECRAGNPNCNVDVVALGQRACDQIITSTTPWSSINWANNTICIQAGDHTAKGTLTIPATANGMPSNYKVLRYTTAAGGMDTDNDPWAQSIAQRAVVSRIDVLGSYWLVHRLTLDGNVGDFSNRVSGGNNILNRVLVQRYNRTMLLLYGTEPNNTVQNSVLRDTGRRPSLDTHCIDTGFSPDHARIVSNEIYDCAGDGLQTSQGSSAVGLIIENNDIYQTTALRSDGGGTLTPSGNFSCGENAVDLKAGGTAADPLKVIQNRFWGFRRTDVNCGGTGSAGDAVVFHQTNSFGLMQSNTMWDVPHAVTAANPAPQRYSIVGNIMFNSRNSPNTGGFSMSLSKASATEVYLNTLIEEKAISAGDSTSHDLRCNVAISSVGFSGTSGQFGNNAYYGSPSANEVGSMDIVLATRTSNVFYSVGQVVRTSAASNCVTGNESACFLYKVIQAGTSGSSAPPYCTELGCTTTDGSLVVKAIRGPYVFKRKLRTVTSGETVAIPYARVHADADETNFCPGAGQVNAVGSRVGIGINDDIAWNGILAEDLTKTSRSGTAGAMEANAGESGGSQTAYPNGTPHAIPGTIQAENYDVGGEGVAYHDTTLGNSKGGYRTDDVDIVAGNEGPYIADNPAGEWLEYSVNVASAGTYKLEMRVASAVNGGSFHIEFDGNDKTGPVTVPNTGGWQIWTIVTRTVTLSAGQQIMRIAHDANGAISVVGNLDYVRFVSQTAYPSGTPHAIPGTVQAEDYDVGGEGVAYHDTTLGNSKGGYRTDDVDIVAGNEGPYIADNPAGEWLEYTINVSTAGSYTLEMRVASAVNGGSFHIEFDGVDKTGANAIPNTGGWQIWTIVTRTVTLSAGQQIMRIAHDANGAIAVVGNIDYVRFTSGAP